jgi:hypothetical protein
MAGLSLSGIAYVGGVEATARATGLATTAPEAVPDVVREGGLPNWPLVEWRQSGGGVMRPPLLAVYADHTAYADAATRLALPPVWVRTLSDQALELLNHPTGLVRNPDAPDDGPVDQVRARTSAGDYLTAHLPGWRNGDRQHAYPPPVRELYQQVEAMRRHVIEAGRPWRPPGVLLGIVALDHKPDRYRDWPEALPTPGRQPYQEIRLPGGRPKASGIYRTGNRFVAATWRYLLPHEIT